MKKKYHVLGNKILKFEADNLTGMKPIYNKKNEIIGWEDK
jgi:hypothetical protein